LFAKSSTHLSLADFLFCCPLILYAWQAFICRGRDWFTLAMLPVLWYLPSRNIHREAGGSRKWWHTDTHSCKLSKLLFWLETNLICLMWENASPTFVLLSLHCKFKKTQFNIIYNCCCADFSHTTYVCLPYSTAKLSIYTS
jgi:hypothetical protein